jgi:hypothetical protein
MNTIVARLAGNVPFLMKDEPVVGARLIVSRRGYKHPETGDVSADVIDRPSDRTSKARRNSHTNARAFFCYELLLPPPGGCGPRALAAD